MNKDQLERNWDKLKGQVKEKWGKITSDDIMVISGKKDQLLGKLGERYGYTADKAKQEVEVFMKTCCGTSKENSKNSQKFV